MVGGAAAGWGLAREGTLRGAAGAGLEDLIRRTEGREVWVVEVRLLVLFLERRLRVGC